MYHNTPSIRRVGDRDPLVLVVAGLIFLGSTYSAIVLHHGTEVAIMSFLELLKALRKK